MFLFRATHGKVLAGSSSFASQTTIAAGRHFVSNPIRSSERYELTATSATSLNQARTLAMCKQARRRPAWAMPHPIDQGHPNPGFDDGCLPDRPW
jgi:hypothetical protein